MIRFENYKYRNGHHLGIKIDIFAIEIESWFSLQLVSVRDQARGRLIGSQGEVVVSLKKKKIFFFFFFWETHFHSVSCGDIIRQSTTTASCFSFH